jgi:predicted  nucleic acid-binding Zn-ribbon protein
MFAILIVLIIVFVAGTVAVKSGVLSKTPAKSVEPVDPVSGGGQQVAEVIDKVKANVLETLRSKMGITEGSERATELKKVVSEAVNREYDKFVAEYGDKIVSADDVKVMEKNITDLVMSNPDILNKTDDSAKRIATMIARKTGELLYSPHNKEGFTTDQLADTVRQLVRTMLDLEGKYVNELKVAVNDAAMKQEKIDELLSAQVTLEEKIGGLETQLKDAKAQAGAYMSDTGESATELQARIAQMEGVLLAEKSAKESLSTRLNTASGELDALRGEIETTKTKLAQAQEDKAEYLRQINVLKEAKTDLEGKLQDAKDRQAEAETSLARARSDLAAAGEGGSESEELTRVKMQLSEAIADKETADERISTLERTLSTKTSEHEAELTANIAAISECQEQVSVLQGEIGPLRSELEAKTMDLETVSGELAALTETHASVSFRVSSLETQLLDLQSSSEASSTRVGELTDELSEMKTAKQKLEGQLTQASEVKSALEGQITSLTGQLSTANEEIERLNKEIAANALVVSEKNTELEAVDKALKALEKSKNEEIVRISAELTAALTAGDQESGAKIDELQAQLTAANADKETAIAAKQKEITDLTTQHAAAIVAKESEYNTLARERDTIAQARDEANAKVAELEKAKGDLIAEHGTALGEVNAHLEAILVELAFYMDEKTRLEGLLAGNNQALLDLAAAHSGEMSEKANEIDSLTQQLTDVTKEKNDKADTILAMQEEMLFYYAEYENMQNEKVKYEQESDKRGLQLKENQEIIDNLTAEVKAHVEKINAAIAEQNRLQSIINDMNQAIDGGSEGEEAGSGPSATPDVIPRTPADDLIDAIADDIHAFMLNPCADLGEVSDLAKNIVNSRSVDFVNRLQGSEQYLDWAICDMSTGGNFAAGKYLAIGFLIKSLFTTDEINDYLSNHTIILTYYRRNINIDGNWFLIESGYTISENNSTKEKVYYVPQEHIDEVHFDVFQGRGYKYYNRYLYGMVVLPHMLSLYRSQEYADAILQLTRYINYAGLLFLLIASHTCGESNIKNYASHAPEVLTILCHKGGIANYSSLSPAQITSTDPGFMPTSTHNVNHSVVELLDTVTKMMEGDA